MAAFCCFCKATWLVLLSVADLQASAVHVHASRGAHEQQQADEQQHEEHSSVRGVLAQALRASAANTHREQLSGSLLGRALSLRPNGPMLMNMTRMNVEDLPTFSRHMNQQTVAADWGEEYPWKGDAPDLFMDDAGGKPTKKRIKIAPIQEWQPWHVVAFALGASAVILMTLGCLAAK